MAEHSPLSIRDLNVALNEAELVSIHVDADAALAIVTLDVLTLPVAGPEPNDRRRRLWLDRVSRVAASYRDGRRDDPNGTRRSRAPLPATFRK